MTSRELFTLLRRRWYLVLLGAVITFVVLWPAANRPGVYWTQVNVVILPPTYQYFPNKLEDPEYSLAGLAGLVVADFNVQVRPLLTASPDTTLFGTGKRTAAEVRLPNMGSQWQLRFTSPTIDVQVVGESAEQVAFQTDEIIRKLNELLERRQDELGIDPTWRATTISSPDAPSIYYVDGSRMRTLGAGAVAGLGLTVAGVYWLERLLARSRNTRAPTPTRRSAHVRDLETSGR